MPLNRPLRFALSAASALILAACDAETVPSSGWTYHHKSSATTPVTISNPRTLN